MLIYEQNYTGMITNVLSIGQSMNYLIGTVLSDAYKLTIVDDVFHGMHLLKTKKNIDLIIVDLDYQTKEAMDFILHISSSRLYKQPVIVLSSEPGFKISESVPHSSVRKHFTKPFNPVDFVTFINQIDASSLSPSLS